MVIAPILLVVFVLISGMAAADRLPNQTPENQVFSMASSVEAIGMYSGSQSLQWTGGYDPVLAFPSDPTSPMFDGYNGWNGDWTLHWLMGDWDFYNQYGLEGYPAGLTFQQYLARLPTDMNVIRPEIRTGAQSLIDYLNAQLGHGGLHTGILDPNEVRATTAYSEMSETNGGYVSETKTFDPDTRNKALDLYNVEATKTFTYATDANTGSVAQTSEMIALDLMGSPTRTADVIACPFGPSVSEFYPAFCNVVYAKSMSQGVTSAAQSSSAQVRMIAATADVGSALNYNFDVRPDASAGIGYAMGTFGTEFGVSIKEARGNNLTPSQTVVYTDKATVAGMVAKFTKQHSYKGFFG